MNIEWMILAEGFGSAADGAITAIGVNQNLIVTPGLPVTTKRALMVHVSIGDTGLANTELDVAVTVLNPSGEPLLTQTTSVQAAPSHWPGIPAMCDIFAEFPLRLTEYGTHIAKVTITWPDGHSDSGTTDLYVVDPGRVAGNLPA